MAAVAERLGVTPMALYRHVANKADLLDGLVERLLTEFPPRRAELAWPERVPDSQLCMSIEPTTGLRLLRRGGAVGSPRSVACAVSRAGCENSVAEGPDPPVHGRNG